MTDNIEITVDNLINDIIDYGDIIPNKIEIVRKMNLKKLNEVRNNFKIDNSSTVILLPDNKYHNEKCQ